VKKKQRTLNKGIKSGHFKALGGGTWGALINEGKMFRKYPGGIKKKAVDETKKTPT